MRYELAPEAVCPFQLFVLERMEGPCGFDRPSVAGVYAVCVRELSDPDDNLGLGQHGERVMYVGSSMNIRKRLMDPSHPLHQLRSVYNMSFIVYLKTYECENYRHREKQLIKLFRPPMNIQHNG